MNICIFSIVNYWQGIKGGMDLHGKLLSEGLVQRDHNVHMISTRHPEGISHESKNGVYYHYLGNTIFGSYKGGWKKECIRKLDELNESLRFDLIWSQSFAGYPYDSQFRHHIGIPIVYIIHGTVIQGLNSWWIDSKSKKLSIRTLKGLFGAIYTYFFIQSPALKTSDHIICVSEQIEKEVRRFHFINEDKTSVVYNGIDCIRFSPDEDKREKIRKQYNINDSEIVLLTMGTINREKGHHLAIEALRILVDKGLSIKLMIVGDGPSLGDLKKQASNLNLDAHVIFCGYIPNENTPDYYNASDIFIFPSLRYEGLPFTVLEALSCGKPVIAHDLGSVRSGLKDGFNGFLVKRGDINQIAQKVILLSGDQLLSKKMSLIARQTALDKFSLEKMIENIIERFEYIVSKKCL